MSQSRKKRRARPAGQRRAYDQAQGQHHTAYDQAQGERRANGNRTQPRNRAGRQEHTASASAPRARADNSIEFPTRTVQNNARRQNRTSQNPRNRNGQARSNANRPAQAASRAPNRPEPQRSGGSPRPAQGVRPPMQREKRKMRRMTRAELRRRRLMRRLTAFALLLCVIGVGIYLTVTMLFKINSIQVQLADGTTVSEAGGYSSERILQVLGVQLGDNIFSFDPDAREEALEKQFPLLEQIEVVRKYPTGVVVRVAEASSAWAMQTEKGWLTLSSTLKILDLTAEQPALPVLYGGEPLSATPGDQLDFAAAEPEAPSAESAAASEQPAKTRLESLNTLLAALESRGLLADITRIEFADTEQIAFLYQDRISVLLGTLNELDYKMDFAQYLLLNTDGKGCGPTDTGSLDCSHIRTDGTLRPILAQGEPAMPSDSAASKQQSALEAETEIETETEETAASGQEAAE